MKKLKLNILIPIIDTCNNCAPRPFVENSKKRYRGKGERCQCLLKLDAHDEFVLNFRKIEIYLALREMNNNSFPSVYYHGLGIHINYQTHLFKSAIMLNPWCIHPYFKRDQKPCFDTYVKQIMDLKIHLQQYRILYSPKPPSYDSLVLGSKYERQLGSRMSLLSCVMDSWFFYEGRRPFFISYKDFLLNKENKGYVKRRTFSNILTTANHLKKFVAFIEKTKVYEEVYNFCVPEDGKLFQLFLQSDYDVQREKCLIH